MIEFYKPLTWEEVDQLFDQGAGYYCEWGFFPPRIPSQGVVVVINGPPLLVADEDIRRGPDGIFNVWIGEDDGRPIPRFEDVFKIEEL